MLVEAAVLLITSSNGYIGISQQLKHVLEEWDNNLKQLQTQPLFKIKITVD